MASLATFKTKCIQFIRCVLPTAKRLASDLPTLPKYFAKLDRKRYKFHEGSQPNWWQLPQNVGQSLFESVESKSLITTVLNTHPFSQVVGKDITFLGKGFRYSKPSDIVTVFLISYLFGAGAERWKPTVFNRVWQDCLSYFNPAEKTVDYSLYAPIAFMPGVARSLDLGDGLEIRRLTAQRIAQLASLNPTLAGVSVFDRLRQWPSCYFVKHIQAEKSISEGINIETAFIFRDEDWVSSLNQEVAFLRALLNEAPALPKYALVRDGYPRDPGGGSLTDLPWRARIPRWTNPPTRKEVDKYARRRRQFLKLKRQPGWEDVAISMRRFAVAWENEFRADILADIVAALEHLVVRSNVEVSYKLRIRTAHFLAKSSAKRKAITKDLNYAYGYRSNVFHGGYVFDDAKDWKAAKSFKRAKGKKGNPFHDVNEVRRLIYATSAYYRQVLRIMIDRGLVQVDWEALGL